MEDLNYLWRQLGPFFQNQGTFFDFQKRPGEGKIKYFWRCIVNSNIVNSDRFWAELSTENNKFNGKSKIFTSKIFTCPPKAIAETLEKVVKYVQS